MAVVGKNEVYDAADAIREEGGLVSQSSVMARLKDRTGRAGSPRDVGPYLLEWKADRTYAPAMERGGVPAAVSTRLGKATADLWSAARVEADRAFQKDRERYETTLSDERALRAETLAMADGLMDRVEILTATTADLRARVSDLEADLTAARGHLRAVRADHFWDRVVHDIHSVLPEAGPMRVSEIADRLGADLAEEARSHAEEWSIRTLRKKIEQRIFHKRLFARCGPGLYRRRRPEDDLTEDAGRTAVT
ncbi:DNA-binding protein [Methylorubrum thiocyanatum]|uniref:DNA-binding protein n=1 Tax=Methylorubrum thiocyanatum TaxID=47958 RepID=UPI00398C2C99